MPRCTGFQLPPARPTVRLAADHIRCHGTTGLPPGWSVEALHLRLSLPSPSGSSLGAGDPPKCWVDVAVKEAAT